MKRLVILATILMLWCIPAHGKPAMEPSRKPEIVDMQLRTESGTGIHYSVEYEKDPTNPLCYTFTLNDGEEPTPIIFSVGWTKAGSDEELGRSHVKTRVLKTGESEKVCLEIPKNVKGKIMGNGFYAPMAVLDDVD